MGKAEIGEPLDCIGLEIVALHKTPWSLITDKNKTRVQLAGSDKWVDEKEVVVLCPGCHANVVAFCHHEVSDDSLHTNEELTPYYLFP